MVTEHFSSSVCTQCWFCVWQAAPFIPLCCVSGANTENRHFLNVVEPPQGEGYFLIIDFQQRAKSLLSTLSLTMFSVFTQSNTQYYTVIRNRRALNVDQRMLKEWKSDYK